MSQPQPTIEVGANPADVARNRMVGVGLVNDPYPIYDRLRETGPVHEGSISSHFGFEGTDAMSWPDRPHFAMYDWETCEAMLRDGRTYSSCTYERILEPTVGRSIIQMDEPIHRRYRALAQPAFTRKEMERWEARWVQPMVDQLIAEIRAKGKSDLYTDYCAKLPVYTIASSWGIAGDDVSRFHEWAVTITSTHAPIEERLKISEQIAAYLREIIAARRAEPSDDLISVLSNVEFTEEDGSHHVLDDDEILAFARLMLPAGAGTTFRGLGSLLFALLHDRDQLDAVRADPELIPAAIEEGLRWEMPLTSLARMATCDTEMAGVKIPEGAIVHACLAAANRDPARWDDPHRFDIHRPPQVHSSFGLGPHLCIGMHLARMELRVGLGAALERLPNLRLDPDAPAPFITGLNFRMPTAVPVVFDA